MTRAEVERALLAGAAAVLEAPPCDVLALGEVGIGNTTAASALFALLTGAPRTRRWGAAPAWATPRWRARRTRCAAPLERTPAGMDVVGKLAAAGGFEIAALAGAVLGRGGAAHPGGAGRLHHRRGRAGGGGAGPRCARLPRRLAPLRRARPRRGAGPPPPPPLLELELRLGEGSGAVLALPLVEAACALLRDVRTFREAGIEEPVDPRGLA
jgi:nicotinate-nucleotide--dimethylbenzimidazole phosphoribosyltransferase